MRSIGLVPFWWHSRMATRLSANFAFIGYRTKSMSSSRTNQTHTVSSSLSQWHQAVATIPLSKILPLLGAGNQLNAYAYDEAWYGDKLIAQEVASQLHRLLSSEAQRRRIFGDHERCTLRSSFHRLHVVAVSNQVLADNIQEILPLHVPPNVEYLTKQQVHRAGTMVEAAIAAVSKHPTNHRSVSNLATYLIDKAIVQWKKRAEASPAVVIFCKNSSDECMKT
jgi:hypothetical protein